MTLRDTLFRFLDRGPEPGRPQDPVEVVRIPAHLGPMTIASLQQRGFHATGEEAMSVVTRTTSDYRLLVRRSEAEAAVVALNELL